VNESQVSKWAKSLGLAWCDKNVDAALSLVSKANIEWQESPFSDPITSWDQIYIIWETDLAKQSDISFTSEVLAVAGEVGIIRWQAQYSNIKDQEVAVLDGIFQITLDENDLCTKFIMWAERKD
jgi:ethanolamine utilization protein EutP (predicted NTPase)